MSVKPPQPPKTCPHSASLHLPWEGDHSPPLMRRYLFSSPLSTQWTKASSATVQASEGPIYKGVCKCFCCSKGYSFITPVDGSPDIFLHIFYLCVNFSQRVGREWELNVASPEERSGGPGARKQG
uniref:Uncharacterized protein n=1 Tax=Vombatus ursinus TaxID=29139 RepID=A0A4X2KEM4_VOMUR